MKNIQLAIGIVGGLTIGSVIGILCMPNKKCHCGKRMAHRGHELKSDIIENIHEEDSPIKKKAE